jgi:hypothetical protein
VTSPTALADTGGSHHGRRSTYTNHGCRCDLCRYAEASYGSARNRQLAYGRWQRRVDANPVRAHLARLHAAGLTWKQIATTAGIATWKLDQLRTGGSGSRPPSRTTSPETAAAILAVPVPATAPPAGLALVDAIGSSRRLQALAAAGWPLRLIATRVRVDRKTLHRLLHGQHPLVRAAVAARIAGIYDLLWDKDPAGQGARPRDTAAAQSLATVHRWAPPLAWDDDDIDNPEALPDWTGRCGTPGGYYDHTVLGTPTCQPCRDAVALAAAGRKLRRRARASTTAA